MNFSFLKGCLVCIVIANLLSCSTTRTINRQTPAIHSLKFLGEYDIPHGYTYQHTTVGGLSGIDYDAKRNSYYFISDDRSAINPARFYTAEISISSKGIDSLTFTGMHYLLQPNGEVYPNSKKDPSNTPDPEAIRYDPVQDRLIWSSEGERITREKEMILADPSIRFVNPDGKYLDSFSLPSNLRMQATEKGPRQNSVFEGLSFADDYQSLFVSVEEPLYEDGPRADIFDNEAYIRIIKFKTKSKKVIKEFAYKLDPIAYQANPVTAYKINGVPDILSTGNEQLLVIERSYSTGRTACTVKLYLAGLHAATDIKEITSLKENRNFTPAEKKLLLNMDDLGIYIDNIEGVTFGPTLANGHRTLLFIADNNFSPIEKSQVLLFEVMDK